MPSSGDGFPDPDVPYWRRHHGIGHPWQSSAAGRRGCLLLLFGGFALILIALLIVIVDGLF